MEKERSLRVNLIPSIADLFFISILFFLFFSGNSGLLGDGDTGYHIRAGEYIINTLSIPRYDIFSFHSPPLPWTAHEWLSEVIMAAIHSSFGLTGIVAFFAFLLALTSYLLFKILRIHQADILIATAVTILVFSSAKIHWLARPHVFSFLLMIMSHYLLEAWHREDKVKSLYFLPPIMLLWVNLHGGYLGGFILMGAYLLGTLAERLSAPPAARTAYSLKLKQLALTISACLAACLINPYGYQILLFPFRLVSDSYIMDHVSEFLSPDFHETMPFKYLLLVLIAILAVSRKSIETTELILILVFINMSLYSARYIPLFALITAPILSRHATEAGTLISGRLAFFCNQRSKNVARIDTAAKGYLWPLTALLVIAVASCYGTQHSFDEKTKPVAASEFIIKEKLAGNMFNNDEFGDYLIYRSYPEYKVFFDGRSDMYGANMMKEYRKVINFERGWEDVLDKYQVTWVFFDSNSTFSRFLLNNSNWVLIYSDKVASIFVKNIPRHKGLIQKYPSVTPAIL